MSEARTQSPEFSGAGPEGDRDPVETQRPPRPLELLRIISILGIGTLRSYQQRETAKQEQAKENGLDYKITFDPNTEDFERLIAELSKVPIPAIELGHVLSLKALFPAERCELVLVYDANDDKHLLVRRILDRFIEDLSIGATIVHIQVSADLLFAGTIDELQSALAPVYKIMGSKRRDEKTILNLTSGSGTCKTLLPTVGAITGTDMFYGSTKDPNVVTNLSPPKVDLSIDATLAQIDMANWFVQRAKSGDALSEFARASGADLATLVEVNGDELEPSPLFESLLNRTLRSEESRTYSFGAKVLTEYAADLRSKVDNRVGPARGDADDSPRALAAKQIKTAEALSARLQKLVGRWVERRLWSLNLVPEMVLHDDRHVQRVERLAAMLAWPLLFDGTIGPRDFFDLCCAAWLHDWGHVGAVYGKGERQRFVVHPLDVRLLHGELSRNLIMTNRLQHGLVMDEQSRIGLLCAHHQGKSCCGAGVPGVAITHPDPLDQPGRHDVMASENAMYELSVGLGKPLPLLEDDVLASAWQKGDGSSSSSLSTFDRVKLLVGILRVADGADIGVHRIPHYETTDDYLAHCAQRSLQYALTMVEAIDPSHPAVGALHEWLLHPTDNSSANFLHGQIAMIGRSEPPTDRDKAIRAALEKALEYMAYVEQQGGHYKKHKLVAIVRFEHEVRQKDDGSTERFWFARVRPTNPESQQDAEDAVDEDIRRELWVDGAAQPFTTLFEEHGLRYAGATADPPSPG